MDEPCVDPCRGEHVLGMEGRKHDDHRRQRQRPQLEPTELSDLVDQNRIKIHFLHFLFHISFHTLHFRLPGLINFGN